MSARAKWKEPYKGYLVKKMQPVKTTLTTFCVSGLGDSPAHDWHGNSYSCFLV